MVCLSVAVGSEKKDQKYISVDGYSTCSVGREWKCQKSNVKRIYFYGDGYGDMSSRWFSVIDYGVKKVLFILMNDIHTKDMEKALIRML